jgi:hypothetical protein
MSPPELYHVSAIWDRNGCLTGHSLVWNPLNGNHEHINELRNELNEPSPLAKNWKPAEAMILRSVEDLDFNTAFESTFALTLKTWKAIEKFAGHTVEFLPMKTTHWIEPDSFEFPKIPGASQNKVGVLHPICNIPFRHSQAGYWDTARRRYNMSASKSHGAVAEACKVPWIDLDDIAGKHLFLLNNDLTASKDFVEFVKSKKMTGITFDRIKYEPKSRMPRSKLTIRTLPTKPDMATAARGFTTKLGKQWTELWEWTAESLKARGWSSKSAKLTKPVKLSSIVAFEKKHGIRIPADYTKVVTEFASGVTVNFGSVKPGTSASEEYDEITKKVKELMFGHEFDLWSFDFTEDEYPSQKEYGESMANNFPGEYQEHHLNKLPFASSGNGDLIALDLKTGVPTYLSMEGDASLQGKPLGKNFVEFITRWSWCCLPWPDFLPATGFYDHKKQRLSDDSSPLKIWHDWLRGISSNP